MTDQKAAEGPQERSEGGSAMLETSEGQNGPQTGAERIDWQRRAKAAEAALDQVRHLADLIDTGAPWTANHTDLAARIRDAANPPAHNAGPTVAECAAQDRAYWTDKHAEEGQ